MPDDIYDVIQVGMGPVGLTLAAVLGQSDHTVAVVERHERLYGLPRAGHIDHEIMRILQSLEAEKTVLEDAYAPQGYVWVNASGTKLLEFDWGTKGISGYDSDYMQYQPVLEDALAARVRADEHVNIWNGWEAVDFRQHDDHVELTVRRTRPSASTGLPTVTDEERVLRGRYLIGADGAASTVRRRLGVERDDLGFNERWLDVDVRTKRELHFDFTCGQICDPARPTCILPLGQRHRRWEWSLLPGETIEEFQMPEAAWRLLAEQGIGPDDVEIVRQLVYTFEARTAQRWRSDRVFLVGDAAHTMPPFMGQGMCQGMRDAKNLGWKLDLVLRGLVPDTLLDTYEEELRPYALDWTVISLEAGKVPCILDPEEARKRDELFASGYRPPMPDFPQVRHGVLAKDEAGQPLAAAGELSLQGPVERNGDVGLFDRVFGANRRWQIVSTAGDPRAVLRPDQLEQLAALGTVFAHISNGPDGDATDVEGVYAAYFDVRNIEVAIARPDFYLFGTGPSLGDLPALVDDLLFQLGLTTSRPVVTT